MPASWKHLSIGAGTMASSDFEDIIFVLNNRSIIWNELGATTGELREYFFSGIEKLTFQSIFGRMDWSEPGLQGTEKGELYPEKHKGICTNGSAG